MIVAVVILCVLGVLTWFLCQFLKQCNPLLTREMRQGHYELFNNFLKFCHDHNLHVFAVAGTLLGAHRHHGMIPWDDDIDVGLMKPDYARLWTLQTSLLDYGLTVEKSGPVMRIFKKNVRSEYHNVPMVDVFPFERKGQKIQHATFRSRLECPREYFFVPEIAQLQLYQFGPLQVPGPSNIDQVCLRLWGQNWYKPQAKFLRKLLYRKEVQKMMQKFLRSARYQQLALSQRK
jgi:hypothetical protein